jgi:outer membrane lipoprotein SlyB
MKNIKIIFGTIVACALISGCAQNVSPNTYDASEVGTVSKVMPGVIISKRAVNIDANSGAGGLAGSIAGAAAGSTVIGGGIAGPIVGAVGGAVVGGLVGEALDKGLNHHNGYEYIIKLKDGATISVAQAAKTQFAVNQHVLIIYGAMTRIIPDTAAG